jgi:hypothetical protein
MSLFNVYIKPLLTQAGLYRRAYPIAHRAYLAYPRFGIAFLEAIALGRARIDTACREIGGTVPLSRRELAPETVRKQKYSWRLFAGLWKSVVRG